MKKAGIFLAAVATAIAGMSLTVSAEGWHENVSMVTENESQAVMKEKESGLHELPERIGSDQRLITLEIPETETFQDDSWYLMPLQLNQEFIDSLKMSAIDKAFKIYHCVSNLSIGDLPELGHKLCDCLKTVNFEEVFKNLNILMNADRDQWIEMVSHAVMASSQNVILQDKVWIENGSEEMSTVVYDRPALYCLVNMNESGTEINGFSVLIDDYWYDLGSFVTLFSDLDLQHARLSRTELREKAFEAALAVMDLALDKAEYEYRVARENTIQETDQEIVPDYTKDASSEMVLKGKELMQYFMSGDENMEFEYLNTKPAVQNYLPTAGLDHIRLIKG